MFKLSKNPLNGIKPHNKCVLDCIVLLNHGNTINVEQKNVLFSHHNPYGSVCGSKQVILRLEPNVSTTQNPLNGIK